MAAGIHFHTCLIQCKYEADSQITMPGPSLTPLLPTLIAFSQAPDEEALPYKAINMLAFTKLQCRVAPEPEYAHPAWNNILLAISRAGLQPTVLVATLLTHINHGPYSSGRTLQTKFETCSEWIKNLSTEEFDELRESIAWDRGVELDSEEVPCSPEDLLAEPTIASRGIFVSWQLLTLSVIVLGHSYYNEYSYLL